MGNEDKVFLTAREAAEYLDISRARLSQLRASGKIAANKYGIWLYRRQELEMFKKIYKFNRRKGK